jgi:peptidyl-tRNA hydrolase
MEAAARGVLTMLADPRWQDEIAAWERGRIRKVVRRARGAAWERAQQLAGIAVEHRTAEVMVYPPVPGDDWPQELAKLQVSGTELDDNSKKLGPAVGAPVLWLNPGIDITAGKAMAQAGHAAHLAWWALDEAGRERWRRDGFRCAVRTASPGQWKRLLDSGLPVVRDGGFTEVEPGTATFVADLAGRSTDR